MRTRSSALDVSSMIVARSHLAPTLLALSAVHSVACNAVWGLDEVELAQGGGGSGPSSVAVTSADTASASNAGGGGPGGGSLACGDLGPCGAGCTEIDVGSCDQTDGELCGCYDDVDCRFDCASDDPVCAYECGEENSCSGDTKAGWSDCNGGAECCFGCRESPCAVRCVDDGTTCVAECGGVTGGDDEDLCKCSSGATCTFSCFDSPCAFECYDASCTIQGQCDGNCAVECFGNEGSCDVACTDSTCNVTCGGEMRCLVTGNVPVRACEGGDWTACSETGPWVCHRDCPA